MKTYTITLNENIVKEAKRYAEEFGGKLSPLINKLLERWVKEQGEK